MLDQQEKVDGSLNDLNQAERILDQSLEDCNHVENTTKTSYPNPVQSKVAECPVQPANGAGGTVSLEVPTDEVEVKNCCGKLCKSCAEFKQQYAGSGNIVEKFVYIFAVLSTFVITFGAIDIPWILPYMHSIYGPLFVGVLRPMLYSRLKWQYFLADFCYFCNLLWLIYIWASPGNRHFFRVLFAFSYGPLFSAILLFRNAMVFHSLDRMTSVYIHIFPAVLSFILRWHPQETSIYWYSEFGSEPSEDFPLQLQFLWLCAFPFVGYLLHMACYFIVIYGIFRPGPEHYTSFSYLTGDESHGPVATALNCAGPKFRPMVYITLNWAMALVMFVLSMIWYNFYAANIVALVCMVLLLIWNGATFQIEVFAHKGLDSEPFTFC